MNKIINNIFSVTLIIGAIIGFVYVFNRSSFLGFTYSCPYIILALGLAVKEECKSVRIVFSILAILTGIIGYTIVSFNDFERVSHILIIIAGIISIVLMFKK